MNRPASMTPPRPSSSTRLPSTKRDTAGRGVTAEDILSLHSVMNAAATQILDFYEKSPRPDVADVLSAIQEAMQTLAWHRGNVEKHAQPELDFEEE